MDGGIVLSVPLSESPGQCQLLSSSSPGKNPQDSEVVPDASGPELAQDSFNKETGEEKKEVIMRGKNEPLRT